MTTCSHPKTVSTEYSVICTHCGVERPIIVNTMDYPQSISSAPLSRLYNRCDRWLSIVKKVVGIHSGPSSSDPVWKYLEKHKQTLLTPSNITQCLRKSKLKNKHYPCLHVFAKTFCSQYACPSTPAPQVLYSLECYFRHILDLWSRAKKKETDPFFSYNWLIEQALYLYNYVDYFPYVKLLKCSARRQRYVQMLLKLYEIRLEKKHRERSADHSHCVICPQSTHHNQLQMPPHPSAQTSENHPFRSFGDSQLDHLYMHAISPGTLEKF